MTPAEAIAQARKGDLRPMYVVAGEERLLRDEVVSRVDRLQLPSYTGFVMPRLHAVSDPSGAISGVEISYPLDLTSQMLEYSAATRHLRE